MNPSEAAPGPTGAAASGSENNNSKNNNNANNKKPIEYNPRWLGYCLIALFSLINVSTVSSVQQSSEFKGKVAAAIGCGVVTFIWALVVVILDRSGLLIETFNYPKVWDGRLEGYVLLVFTLFWAACVGFITQVDGLGFLTLNIYFSSWITFFSCIYTLNLWSESKDILSIAELTGISPTLKAWYVLFFSSLVVFGTCMNLFVYISSYTDQDTLWTRSTNFSDAVFGSIIAFASCCLSFSMICVHYNFIECCSQGGWLEISLCVVLCLVWIMAVGLMTRSGGVAATMVGSDFDLRNSFQQVPQEAVVYGRPGDVPTYDELTTANCTFELTLFTESNLFQVIRIPCNAVLRNTVPGSNLYLFTWLALLSSVQVGLRWKALKAIQFAQAQNKKALAQASIDDKAEKDDDDDDDDDEFEDATDG